MKKFIVIYHNCEVVLNSVHSAEIEKVFDKLYLAIAYAKTIKRNCYINWGSLPRYIVHEDGKTIRYND